MRFAEIGLSTAVLLFALGFPARNAGQAAMPSAPALTLRAERSSPLDLEVGGELAGVPAGATRYLTRDELQTLPQEAFVVKNDANFTGPTEVSGVPLEELIHKLGAAPDSDMVVAICDDQYRANYPQAYIAAHQPLLVLKVNGKPPAGWPKDAEGHGMDMSPYMISHRKFLPSFKSSPHGDEAQIPWGVVRLEFRNEKTVYGAIAPRGPQADSEAVQEGYWIARQNCFRCHNNGNEGGTKAGRPWPVLAAWASSSPEYFAAYIRNPQSKNPHAQMPGNPSYTDKMISALTAYFRTFTASETQEKP